jgi:TIR domain/Domain of unknown function (DUF4384)
MKQPLSVDDAEVFISYSSRDRERVIKIAGQLEEAGVKLWLDRNKIAGGLNYGPEIVRGIKNCKVLMLMTTDASMRSRNVKQEIQLAWKYERPYLPILLDPINLPEQIEYWLEGWQWVDVIDRAVEQWLPQVLQSLELAGVDCRTRVGLAGTKPAAEPQPLAHGIEGLRSIARFTDRIWPVPAGAASRGAARPILRDLGAPQEEAQHGFRPGDRVCLAIESEREGDLLLLNEGTSGQIYCLCPSWFAPDPRFKAGRSYLPRPGSTYQSFVVTGNPGREHLLAVLTDHPLGLDWMPRDPRIPARVLSRTDIDELLARLHGMEANQWMALSTYFDVM